MFLRISSRKQRELFSKPRRSKVGLFPWLMSVLAISLIVGYKQIESYLVQPDAIFVLGGEEERELFAAKFAQQHPEIPIWVSSGSPEWYTKKVFAKAGIDSNRLHIDRQAVDTVTNFTTLVEELQARNINSVYLITSDDHMRRARVIGEIVFGSRGIVLKPVPISSGREPESLEKALRDGARAILWVTTGHTGASIGRELSEN
ncbi:MAG: YdcF family protein [Coleofasciculus sp. S288]|nr:YdcF family protein [Coleofasciculus sp. S288]